MHAGYARKAARTKKQGSSTPKLDECTFFDCVAARHVADLDRDLRICIFHAVAPGILRRSRLCGAGDGRDTVAVALHLFQAAARVHARHRVLFQLL